MFSHRDFLHLAQPDEQSLAVKKNNSASPEGLGNTGQLYSKYWRGLRSIGGWRSGGKQKQREDPISHGHSLRRTPFPHNLSA